MHRALVLAVGATFVASTSQHSIGPTHGVSPALLSSYTPSTSSGNKTWKCLSSGETIAWSAVNDDYCDCSDGSDEPGTGACRDTTFFCQNKGHIGASIPSSRVKDGLCEKECCDGSDEAPGICPDTCAELGQEYRAKIDAVNKLRRTGSKIRSSYITFAQKEKRRLELEIEKTAGQVKESEAEVERLRDIATRAESLSASTLNHLKLSPLYQSLTTHSLALKSLRAQHNTLVDEHSELENILSSLRESFNPNYQDMGVLAAVRAYEKIAGLPHINDVRNAADEADGTVVKTEEEEGIIPAEENVDDGKERLWNATELEEKLDDLIMSDTESLLLEHDKHAASPAASAGDSLLFDLGSYLPDAVKPQYETVRNTLLSWLGAPQAAKSEADNEALARARAALSEAETALRNDKSSHETAITDLRDLFSPTKFGTQGEWKKLDKTCLSHDAGEYTYEVCLFDEAKQKPGPGKGGGTFSLGRFEGWSGEEGTGERTMKFGDGARCWNGPARSVQVRLKCGTENVLLSVAELEKCEYEITGTSPALCLPLSVEGGDVKKEEL